MLLHLIHFKGKGGWVIVLALLIAAILFQLADIFPINKTFTGAFTLIISGILLFLYENKRTTILEGNIVVKKVKLPRKKNKNTMMWIVRYWGITMTLIGLAWLLHLLTKPDYI